MTTAAKPNFGKQLWMAPTGQSLVQVAELITLKQPGRTRGIVDVTSHSSAQDAAGGVPMEKLPEKVYDPGQVTGQVHYVAGSAFDDAAIEAFGSMALYDFKIVIPATGTTTEQETFSGFLTVYDPQDAPVRGVQVANFTVEISGVRTQTAGA